MRASSRSRSVAQACQACRLCTGWCRLDQRRRRAGARAPSTSSGERRGADHDRDRRAGRQPPGSVAERARRRQHRRRQRPAARPGGPAPGASRSRRPWCRTPTTQARPVRGPVAPTGPRRRRPRCGRCAGPVLVRPARRREPRSPGRPRRRAPTTAPGAACCACRPGRRRRPRPGRCAARRRRASAPQVDLGLDRAAVAEREHPGHRRDRVQVDVLADLGAERSRVRRHPRRARRGWRHRARRRAARPARAAGAPCRRVGSRPGSTLRSRIRAPAAESDHPARRGDQQQPAERRPTTTRRRAARPGRGGRPRGCCRHEPGQPAQPGSVRSGKVKTIWPICVLRGTGRTLRSAASRGRGHLVERGGQAPSRRVLVEVGDGDLGEALAEPGDHLGRGEAAAAEVEEVVARVGDDGAEDVEPELCDPAPRCPQLGGLAGAGSVGSGQGSALRSTFPDVFVGRTSPRPAGARARRAAPRAGAHRQVGVEAVVGRDVARPGAGCPSSARTAAAAAPSRPGSAEQGVVDLAELDPPAAELDLVVGPADEDQPLGSSYAPGRRCGRPGPSPASATAAYFSASFSGSR